MKEVKFDDLYKIFCTNVVRDKLGVSISLSYPKKDGNPFDFKEVNFEALQGGNANYQNAFSELLTLKKSLEFGMKRLYSTYESMNSNKFFNYDISRRFFIFISGGYLPEENFDKYFKSSFPIASQTVLKGVSYKNPTEQEMLEEMVRGYSISNEYTNEQQVEDFPYNRSLKSLENFLKSEYSPLFSTVVTTCDKFHFNYRVSYGMTNEIDCTKEWQELCLLYLGKDYLDAYEAHCTELQQKVSPTSVVSTLNRDLEYLDHLKEIYDKLSSERISLPLSLDNCLYADRKNCDLVTSPEQVLDVQKDINCDLVDDVEEDKNESCVDFFVLEDK